MKIGDRVVVRRTAGVVAGRQRFTDVLGELTDDADGLTVRRDNGETVTIPSTAVAAAKTIPPKPPSYRAVATLERACADSWPAVDTVWLGGWLLRASHGWTNRANTVLPLGDPGTDLDTALDEVTRWYSAHGLPPGFGVPLPLSKRLAAALTERGWRTTHTVRVMTVPLADLGDADSSAVTVTGEPGPEWLALATAGKGDLPPAASAVLGSGDDRAFAGIRRDTRLVACGRGAVSGEVAVLSLIAVAADMRRRGLAREVVNALAGWARDRGATTGCVQVESDNTAALALYARLGFTVHHHYVNMRPPGARTMPESSLQRAAL